MAAYRHDAPVRSTTRLCPAVFTAVSLPHDPIHLHLLEPLKLKPENTKRLKNSNRPHASRTPRIVTMSSFLAQVSHSGQQLRCDRTRILKQRVAAGAVCRNHPSHRARSRYAHPVAPASTERDLSICRQGDALFHWETGLGLGGSHRNFSLNQNPDPQVRMSHGAQTPLPEDPQLPG